MARSSPKPLILGAFILLGGVMLFLFLGPGGGESSSDQESALEFGGQAASLESANRAEVRLPEASVSADRPAVSGPTTVLWPLVVELNLERPSYLPEVPSGPPLGSGRTAQLAGKIVKARGVAAEATIEFVDGPNRGRVLRTDADGAYGASDLYPGIDLVEVSGPGLIGARREVLLRQGKERLLNVSFGRPAALAGEVIDEAGEPIVGAKVRIDGHTAMTDTAGAFYFDSVAPGSTLLEITHPGYASHRGILRVMQNSTTPLGRIKYVLERGCVLDLAADLSVGSGDIEVYLMPPSGPSERKFPWHLVNPVRINTGQAQIKDLPSGPLQIRAYRAGAIARPVVTAINLNPGQDHTVQINFNSAPSLHGTVLQDGKLVSGAQVELIAADPARALTAHYREPLSYLEADVFPLLPPARQSVTTDSAGHFHLTRWQQTSAYRLARATSPDGKSWGMAAVGPTDESIELELETIEAGQGSIRIELPGRFQSLPVTVLVSGKPRPTFELPADRELEIGDLREGTWTATASWHVQKLLDEGPFEVDSSTLLEVRLPEEALIGQDQSTWERAGREYPLP